MSIRSMRRSPSQTNGRRLYTRANRRNALWPTKSWARPMLRDSARIRSRTLAPDKAGEGARELADLDAASVTAMNVGATDAAADVRRRRPPSGGGGGGSSRGAATSTSGALGAAGGSTAGRQLSGTVPTDVGATATAATSAGGCCCGGAGGRCSLAATAGRHELGWQCTGGP